MMSGQRPDFYRYAAWNWCGRARNVFRARSVGGSVNLKPERRQPAVRHHRLLARAAVCVWLVEAASLCASLALVLRAAPVESLASMDGCLHCSPLLPAALDIRRGSPINHRAQHLPVRAEPSLSCGMSAPRVFKSPSCPPSSSHPSARRQPRETTKLWVASAVCTALGLAVLVLGTLGAGERGTYIALQVTARLSFLLFWPAYVSGALTALLGATFQPLQLRARDLGLAFASAHLVHIGLVVWLCHIGAAPPLASFIVFGIATLCLYLLALFSLGDLQRALGRNTWWLLRTCGLNYIALAFALDFLRYPISGDARYLLGYLPFAALSVLGPLLQTRCICASARNSAAKVEPVSRLRRTTRTTGLRLPHVLAPTHGWDRWS